MSSSSIDWRRVVSSACLKYDWTKLAEAALGSSELAAVVGEAFRAIGTSIEHDIALTDDQRVPTSPAVEAANEATAEPTHVASSDDNSPPIAVDEAASVAATLLGVTVHATADEVRAALRARLSASCLHPDHGGDGEEAKALIAAKNLLVERARAARA